MIENNIFITGDKHGQFDEMLRRFYGYIPAHSTIIILGDVGLNYYENTTDLINKEKLQQSGHTYLCLRGNHERRPIGEKKYISNDTFGGTFIVEDYYPNILYFIDGNDYRITVNGNRKKCIAIGGAYSVDKYYRLAKQAAGHSGYKWFEDEQLNEEEKSLIINKLKAYNQYDYVLSHTCPRNMIPTDMFLPQVDQSTVDNSMEDFLQEVSDMTEFEKWYCGHWHTDRIVDKYRFMYNDIICFGENY